MINRLLLCSVMVLFCAAIRAEEVVRSTQEELRRRNIYFGDVDGRNSRELEEALRRYQTRKGLAATGHEDRETLRSLGLVARAPGEPPPKDLEWPEEPVLKSDAKLDVPGTAQEISSSNAVSLSSLLPESVASGPRATQATRSRMRPGTKTKTASDAPSEGPRFSLGKNGQLQSELTTYLRNYLRAASRNRLEDELHFYADRVDYLGNGWVDRRIIEQSLRKYYHRWPNRSYAQVGEIRYRSVPSRGVIVVTFHTDFTVKRGGFRAHGQTANEMVINAATADPRIVSIKEQRVRR